MTDQARARKIDKALGMYSDPASSPEQKAAAADAIVRLQSGLSPEFWKDRAAPVRVHRTRVQRAPEQPATAPMMNPMGVTLGDLVTSAVDAGMKHLLKRINMDLR